MSQTTTAPSAALGSYAATVRYSKELMVRAQRQRAMHRRLTGKVPNGMSSLDGKVETSHGHPVVQLFELDKGDGDRVTVDLVNRIGGKPVAGDTIARSTASPITIQRDELKINQLRKVINTGGRMAQKRTPHNLRQIGMGLALNYINNLEDQLFLAHLAGDRGQQTGDEFPVPLSTDPDFADICVNTILPPTYNRKFYPGSATSLANLSTSDTLKLSLFDKLKTVAVTSSVPLKGVKMDGNFTSDDTSPLFLAIISEEGWNSLQTNTDTQSWRTFLAQANERLNYKSHPLFQDMEIGLWRNIAIMHTARAIEFASGSSVSEYDSSGTLQTVSANVRAHRGVLLGAEAMGIAFGSAKPINLGGNNQGGGSTEQLGSYSWVEEVTDGGNNLDLYIGMMCGFKKLRYNFNGAAWDNGVIAFDYYVPAL